MTGGQATPTGPRRVRIAVDIGGTFTDLQILDVTVGDLVAGQGVLQSDVAALQAQLDALTTTEADDVSGFAP